MEIIGIAIGAACIFILQAVIYKKFWHINLTVLAAFAQRSITEGEEGELYETIINQKWLPLPMLRVKFETDRHLDFMQEENLAVTDRCYKHDIFTVMMFQKITRKLNFRADRRGFYEIKQISIDSTDLFMERHLDKDVACSASIYVYPRQADPGRLLIPFQKMMGEVLTRRYAYEDPFEFQGIRPYESFDSMRDVNWKASARTGELRTNLHGYTVRQEVCLLLNLESETIMDYKQLKEESIRLANSLAEMFFAQGIPVGVYSNAKDLLTGRELEQLPGGGGQHLTQIRESLARLDLSQQMEEFGTFLKKHMEDSGRTDMMYVMVSSSQRPSACEQFQQLCSAYTGGVWLLPLYSWMEQKVFSSPDLSVMRWDIES